MAKRSGNPNHPKKGSAIKVNPVRSSQHIETIKANGYSLDIKNPHQPEVEHQYTSSELLDLLHGSFAKGDELLDQLRKGLVSWVIW